MSLRKSLVKLASEKPDLRRHILPLLREARGMERTLFIKGRDFKMEVDTTSFSALSPDSDLESDDPMYASIESRSPIGAEMLYRMIQDNPHLLEKITWANLGNWLRGHRISFDLDYNV